ncbi:L domain-like protein [Rhizoclosmatium globosum]|uniref:L domain-like protein n=1 Tax=Rhizoclosmatium globosum TaxID=329046 RepID=A0A1Y2CVE7_9FUNG|nr:L domain-like protein [Rhizoclosmatium globosum]|eukprot:ORY50947.1 L domain-like protein [Rhizoclosmatium globosum]
MQIESPLPSQHSRPPIDSLMDLPFDVLVLILVGCILPMPLPLHVTTLNIHLTDHRSLSDVNDFEEVFFLSPSVQYQEVYAAKKANVTTDLTFAWLRRCGPIPEALGYFRWLEYLTIKSCVCPGPIPSSIITLTELGVLSLEGCRLSGLIPVELGQLTKLEHLSLADNEQLYGPLYAEWGSLTLLHFLDLSGTGVTGLIPPEWGNMGNLHTLILTSTRMNGPIPRELGRCTELQRLELTDSSTIGVIPGELRNVPFLIVEGNDEVIFEV